MAKVVMLMDGSPQSLRVQVIDLQDELSTQDVANLVTQRVGTSNPKSNERCNLSSDVISEDVKIQTGFRQHDHKGLCMLTSFRLISMIPTLKSNDCAVFSMLYIGRQTPTEDQEDY